jgi:hypothetical protein
VLTASPENDIRNASPALLPFGAPSLVIETSLTAVKHASSPMPRGVPGTAQSTN